ncbi:MAG: pseudouridine synthase [Lentisphaeria bacterium]
MPVSDSSQRLAKYLAACGLASRRACEEVIAAGRVTVNGTAVTTPAFNVTSGRDQVAVDGKPVAPQKRVWLALNKPPGYTCSAQDAHAVKLVFELLPADLGRLFTVGRLDRDSEGLLLLTNDGDCALHLAHPRYETTKIYRVWTPRLPTPELLRRLTTGIEDDGQFLQARHARVAGRAGAGAVVELTLTEGRKREIRRMFDALELPVQRLQRIAHGPVRLGSLPIGQWRHLTTVERNTLEGNSAAAPRGGFPRPQPPSAERQPPPSAGQNNRVHSRPPSAPASRPFPRPYPRPQPGPHQSPRPAAPSPATSHARPAPGPYRDAPRGHVARPVPRTPERPETKPAGPGGFGHGRAAVPAGHSRPRPQPGAHQSPRPAAPSPAASHARPAPKPHRDAPRERTAKLGAGNPAPKRPAEKAKAFAKFMKN